VQEVVLVEVEEVGRDGHALAVALALVQVDDDPHGAILAGVPGGWIMYPIIGDGQVGFAGMRPRIDGSLG
jgi:hypothetical protein